MSKETVIDAAKELLNKIAANQQKQQRNQQKQAAVMMPGGAPPMDPAMMDPAMMDPAMAGGGGMPPMDPAMMAAMAGGGGMPPMDPAMMDPAMAAGGAPMPPPPMDPAMADQIRQIVREETGNGGNGGAGGAAGAGGKGGKEQVLNSRLDRIESLLTNVLTALAQRGGMDLSRIAALSEEQAAPEGSMTPPPGQETEKVGSVDKRHVINNTICLLKDMRKDLYGGNR